MKKRIGISFTETNFHNYPHWFQPEDLGEDVEIVTLSFVERNEQDIYTCDGFVLTGGIDVLPSLYGGAEQYPYKPERFLPERDAFEKRIYEYAQEQQIPVLGICRGLQYINILEGGKVYEDIGATANLIHKKDKADKIHDVNIRKDSLLYAITGVENGQVNSAHHQGIDPEHLGHNLMISATSATGDAIIEGIEFRDKTGKGFMIGVQWHPERMPEKESNPLSSAIKKQFIQAVRNYHK
ncbi:gamma-glutamyl-gamma-aminobutyrate hydrolase family protein [Chitinophaga sp. 212800010-3]|uniref:gamma-glutamyl-gamma-aminobutyrate hydrolase family protein n=1 Tax=unclassified Chitinophaga TaxID=2619133 RepID=UPI002DF5D786|nr:gamma-glutamyl-gamma-aminobutyrate hydrolase family protein [Chitinophaga sp. 212800010-3]MEC5142730.1 Gamma-glutamyl-gamma-aminobutyrate hydrolase family protein [Chitinophaga sp. 212800010-3]